MGCPACGAENPAANKFCGSCGSALAARCAACGHPNPPTNRFCGECGSPLTPPSRTPAPALPPSSSTPESYTPRHLADKILASRDALEGERKQVTVLFADIKGSTELVRARDPEDAQRLLDGAVQRMMGAIHRYEGTVSRLMGDGLMAMFGAPVAHEDHAVRACYAALAMLESVRDYADEVRQAHGAAIQIRVGLNSGEVIVRLIADDLHMDYTAMGQTVHLAARMEQVAAPGTVRLTADTLRLVEGYVQTRSLGPVPIKGLDAPVEVCELLGLRAARTRLEASVPARVDPLRGATRRRGGD
jgi:class 3 adenylate cyclase